MIYHWRYKKVQFYLKNRNFEKYIKHFFLNLGTKSQKFLGIHFKDLQMILEYFNVQNKERKRKGMILSYVVIF